MNDNRRDTWEPVGDAAARVLVKVRKAMESKRKKLSALAYGREG